MENKIGTIAYNRERKEKLNRIQSILNKNFGEITLPYKALVINSVFIGNVSKDGIESEDASKCFIYSELNNIQLELIISNIVYYAKSK